MKQGIAILLVIIVFIPGILIGGVVKYLYLAMAVRWLGNETSFFPIFSSASNAIFVAVVPNAVHGVVGGALAVYGASLVLKNHRFETAAFSVAAIIVLISLFVGGYVTSIDGFSMNTVALVSQVSGIVVGFVGSAKAIDEKIRSNISTSKT